MIKKNQVGNKVGSKKIKNAENQVINSVTSRPTGIRTPTDGTKNQSATVTPWVCLYFGGANLKNFFLLHKTFLKIYFKFLKIKITKYFL